MSVEFRQRTANDVIRMLKRRKWLILLPVLTMTVAVGYVVRNLPSIYESRTLLIVKPPRISEKVAQSLSDEDLTQRLQSINKQVLSHTELEPMILKYDLFKTERQNGVPMEIILGKMSRNITVDTERSDDETKVAAFSIKYRDRSPEAARNVTSELAGKYIKAQVEATTNVTRETAEFIEKTFEEKKTTLDELEKERLRIMSQNVETLPENAQGLIAQLEGLRQREQGIGKEKETLILEKGRLNDNIQSINSQIRLIDEFRQKEIEEAQKRQSGLPQSPVYAQLLAKRAELNANLDKLKLTLRDKHPDVIKAKTDIEKINDEIEKLEKSQSQSAEGDVSAISRKYDMQKQSLLIEKKQKENQIALTEQQIGTKDEDLGKNAAQIRDIESKLNQIPSVAVALESINTRYQPAKAAYDNALEMKNKANVDADRAQNAQGETISIQDPANLPETPVAPKRGMLTLFGAGLGFGIGLFLAALFEVPRVLKIQNIEDTKHYTGLPVLASVPPLLSPQEKTWQSRIHWLKVLAGFAAAVGSIPLIIVALQITRIFELVVS
ncbi:MAG: hypothetical protein R2747_12310 [Pyrinomonadaceae bacterium]